LKKKLKEYFIFVKRQFPTLLPQGKKREIMGAATRRRW